MIGNVFVAHRGRPWAALCLGVLACVAARTASAADCPGHPDALGTSRTLVVDPREHPLIGTMQYAKTLPLEDHEVVLTFDDGPLPKYSNQILDILAAQCVKATFFLVGRQANANPEGVRKVRDAGHTVATHTQNHPTNMQRMPIDRAQKEMDDGIASATAALGDGTAPAPFFRIPGLARADGIEAYAASKGIQVWSADFPADDWRHVSPQRVYDLAIQRLAAKGKGILLLHDIQPRTVAALPKILHELKARGYRIVHVVPATADRPATPTEPQQWLLRPASENVAISRWPKIPGFVYAASVAMPTPDVADLDWRGIDWSARPQRTVRGQTSWPSLAGLPQGPAAALPIPAASIFKIPESTAVTLLASLTRRAATATMAAQETEVAAKRGTVRAGNPRTQARTVAVRQVRGRAVATRQAHAGKPVAPGKKNARSVRVAGLKKR